MAQHQPYYCDKATGQPVFPPYHLQNLSGNITKQRQRLGALEQRAQVASALAAEETPTC